MKLDPLSSLLRKCVLVAGLATASVSSAVPISYEGVLSTDVTVGGFVSDPGLTGSPADDFWSFFGEEGATITLTGNRLFVGLDLAMELYFGVGTDTAGLSLITNADDNYPELPGFDGPFADPQITLTLQQTGFYTVQMWSFLSDALPDGGACYQLTLGTPPSGQEFSCAAAVPEPGSMALLAIALVGLAGTTRRRQSAAV